MKPRRKAQKPPWQRWTESIDGWSSNYDKPPGHVRDAISRAFPMPATFREAKAEADYWERRDDDLKHALSPDGNGLGDYALDFPCTLRWEMVRDLASRDMPVDNLADLVARFEIYRESEATDVETEDAIFRTSKRWRRQSSGSRRHLSRAQQTELQTHSGRARP